MTESGEMACIGAGDGSTSILKVLGGIFGPNQTLHLDGVQILLFYVFFTQIFLVMRYSTLYSVMRFSSFSVSLIRFQLTIVFKNKKTILQISANSQSYYLPGQVTQRWDLRKFVNWVWSCKHWSYVGSSYTVWQIQGINKTLCVSSLSLWLNPCRISNPVSYTNYLYQ